MKTILQLVLGTALLQPQYPQEKPTWVKVDDVSHQQYNQDLDKHQSVVVDFILSSDSTFDVWQEDLRMWVELYSPNKDTMLVLASDTANDAYVIWVKQQ